MVRVAGVLAHLSDSPSIIPRSKAYRLSTPVVAWVQGDAGCIAPDLMPSPLCPLLCRVVMSLTQWLPVGLIPEQLRVALVRDDVVNHRSGGDTPYLLAHAAERVAL